MATVFGRYELLKRIAAGGRGEVFLAQRGDETVVVKRLLPHLAHDAAAQAMFREEARIASQVRHPNLVKVLELGEVDGQWFLSMEYVRGISLHDRMTLGRFELNESLRIVADLAGALAAVHSARDVNGQALHAAHRDVTPRNVMIDAEGAVKLIDFGVAGTRTLEYAAPEDEVDARADQYSLGVIFWELLSGRGLFHADSDAQTVELVEEGVIARPPKSVSDEIVQVAMRMLSRDPAARFESCEQVRLVLLELSDAPTAPLVASRLSTKLERPTSSFVGRASELEALEQLVKAGAHKVTIVGRSGLGKTRVALELSERVGPAVEVMTSLEPVGETVYVLPPLSPDDAAALYFARSGRSAGSAQASDGLALTVELLAALGTPQPNDLHGAFDAAWAKLALNGREVLAALSKTPGSVTLEEAEALDADALDVLEVLRDAGLLQVVDIGDGELRFGLHDAIRALVHLTV